MTGLPPARTSTATRGTTYLGIDLGTSGLKLTLLGRDGDVVAEAEEAYEVTAPEPGWAETDPEAWWSALDRCLDRLAAATPPERAGSVAGVGFSGQMHGVVLSAPDGRPTRPALLWPDRRAASVLDRWHGLAPEVRASLSNPLVAGMAGPLLTWLREHEPSALQDALVASPKDWLRRRLTGGDAAGERSDATATLLWDLVADDWSEPALALAGVAREQLPVISPSDTVVGTTSLLAERGLATDDVPAVIGAGDTAAALAGLTLSGAVPAGEESVVVNAGTGIQILRTGVRPTPRLDPVTHVYGDAAGGWYEMLAIQNGGFALTWAQDALSASWEESVALARSVAPGSGGAVFLPFLTGERGGVAPPTPSAGWRSLTTSTGRPELVRAAFEAYAFTIRRGLETLGSPDGRLLLSGGGGRDPWVRQLLADVLGRSITFVRLRSASAVGAAALAARGCGEELSVPATVVHTDPGDHTVGDQLDEAYLRWVRELDASRP